MRRFGTVAAAAAVCAAVLPALPAGAADPVTVELTSGPGAVGSRDAHTDISVDGGSTWQDAWIVAPNSLYSTIPGTSWLSDVSGQRPGPTEFRRAFELPDGAQDATLRVCLHADNDATIRLNGVLVGAQPVGALFSNFQGAPECFDAPVGALAEGTNTLLFSIRNYGGPMGLDYRATLSYTEEVDEPPVLDLPEDVSVEAPERSGTPVEFEATATDPDGGDVTVVCDPASGSLFPVGTTEVECSATDDEGTRSTGTFDVTVTYTNRPPVLAQAEDVVVDAERPSGAAVSYGTPAVTDDGVGTSTVDCDPPSGSEFAIGSSTVTCVATDDEGLGSAPVTFTVHVRGAAAQLGDLLADVTGVGPGRSLAAKVRTAVAALEAGDPAAACGALQALLNEVRAQTGKSLSAAQASAITADATRIRAVLGC